MKIKIKCDNDYMPQIISKGDWIDLYACEDVHISGPLHNEKTGGVAIFNKLINLGVAMKLPGGFEAVVLPRSSTYKNHHIILANSQGVIDQSYCGNNDVWKFNAIAFDETYIHKGDRIAQFRIQLSQKATFWQKIKWFFSSKIKLVRVVDLGDNNRGGFGSTGR